VTNVVDFFNKSCFLILLFVKHVNVSISLRAKFRTFY